MLRIDLLIWQELQFLPIWWLSSWESPPKFTLEDIYKLLLIVLWEMRRLQEKIYQEILLHYSWNLITCKSWKLHKASHLKKFNLQKLIKSPNSKTDGIMAYFSKSSIKELSNIILDFIRDFFFCKYRYNLIIKNMQLPLSDVDFYERKIFRL